MYRKPSLNARQRLLRDMGTQPQCLRSLFQAPYILTIVNSVMGVSAKAGNVPHHIEAI